MTRRALVIGAQTFGLHGVDYDVQAMAVALNKQGFEVRRCQGPQATRDEIVAAYEQLIASSSAGDAAVVYYSGHGGYARPLPGETVEVDPTNRQFIVPTDFTDPVGDDFRGITAVELSVLLRRLTDRTGNAVVILDCCHAAFMSRELGDLRPRQLPRTTMLDIRAHLRRRGAGLEINLAERDGNPNAVRLVACADDQLAYEAPRLDGPGYQGVFTDAVIRTLDATNGTRANWSMVMGRVRQLVHLRVPHQRPEAAGPADRRLFEAGGENLAGSLPVMLQGDGTIRLEAAALLGAEVGDEFVIMPATADGPADGEAIATVRVENVGPVAATGRPFYRVPGSIVPPDARAFRSLAVPRRVPVHVPDRLKAAVERRSFVRPAEPAEKTQIEVCVSADGALYVRDGVGPLREPAHTAEAQILDDLDGIARAIMLSAIADQAHWSFAPKVNLEFGRLEGIKPIPLEAGATLHVQDRAYLKIRNDDNQALYLSLIDIGVAYAIKLLTNIAPSGHLLASGAEFAFGEDWNGQLVGKELAWPTGVNRRTVRPETLLAILTSEPQDLSAIVQHGVRGEAHERSALGDLIAHLAGGAAREFYDPPRFCAMRVQFSLDPTVRRDHE